MPASRWEVWDGAADLLRAHARVCLLESVRVCVRVCVSELCACVCVCAREKDTQRV